MKSRLKLLIISAFMGLLVAPIIAQTHTGNNLTLNIGDCVLDEDGYWSNNYTLTVTPNIPIKINYTLNTHDFFCIYTYNNGVFHSYISQSVPTNGQQSVTVISTSGNIYIGCEYNGTVLNTNPIYSLNYLIDSNSTISSNLSMIMNDQYIGGKLGIGIPAREKLDVNGNAIINNKLTVGSSNLSSWSKFSIYNTTDDYSLYSSSSKNTTSSVYGLHSYANNSTGNVYGIYSTVNGQAEKKWAGYFNGGNVAIVNGNLGVGVENPLGILHVRGTSDNSWIYFASNAGFTKLKPRVGYGLAFTWNLSGGEDESIINYSGGTSSRLDFTSWDGTNLKTEMTLKRGNLGIGTTNPDQMLTVNGNIHAKEIIVDVNILADFVFKPTYKLMPLHEVEQFVKTNSHLPEIPSAAEVSKNGMSMGEMQNKLLQKIEELTLYVIELQKTNEKQNAEIQELKQK